jgi:hypothetical protein
MVVGLPGQSVPITTKVVGLIPANGEVYTIQHWVIKFVSDLQQVSVFSRYSGFLHEITEILLKVALNNIILTLDQTQIFQLRNVFSNIYTCTCLNIIYNDVHNSDFFTSSFNCITNYNGKWFT